MARTPITLVAWSIVVLCRSVLDSAGFFENHLQISVWEPSQVGSWLGFHLDFITVPLLKITKLQESISRILAQRFVNAKDLASVAGQLNFKFLAIGNIVRLMSRAMYSQILAQNSWFSIFYLEDSVVEKLVFWQSNLEKFDSISLKPLHRLFHGSPGSFMEFTGIKWHT